MTFLKLPASALRTVRDEGVAQLLRQSRTYLQNRVWMVAPHVRYLSHRLKYGRAAPKPFRVLRVDPERILDGPYFSRLEDIGRIVDGDWDREFSSFEEDGTYQVLRERFVEGKDWEETSSYQQTRAEFEDRDEIMNYESFEQFRKERLPYLDELYADIRKNGYKTQRELRGKNRDRTRHETYSRHDLRTHEVGVNIGRHGHLMINDGYHRLSIARILELDSIPVNVIVRHAKWQRVRRSIAGAERSDALSQRVKSHLTHPDVRDVVPGAAGSLSDDSDGGTMK